MSAFPVTSKIDESERRLKTYKNLRTLIVSFAAVLAVAAVAVYALKYWGAPLGAQTEFGQFGDYIGGVLNPLLSFLALIAILQSLILQSVELVDTRKELEMSRVALQRQGDLVSRQLSVDTFFRMLGLLENDSNALATRVGGGKSVLQSFLEQLSSTFESLTNRHPNRGSLECAASAYRKHAQIHGPAIRRFSQGVWQILRLVDEQDLGRKSVPVDLLKARVTGLEYQLLLAVCAYDPGAKNLKQLATKYGLFEAIDKGSLLMHGDHAANIFAEEAFVRWFDPES